MNKFAILCADDFGLNQAVSQGIINLIANRRLSAVSCMTNMPSWDQSSVELIKFRDSISIGLHFNLPTPSLRQIVIKSYLRQLDRKIIKDALQNQIDRFKQKLGCLPDFIDGHQHIHQLPMIRNVFIGVIKDNYSGKLPLVRIASNGLLNSLKSSAKATLIHCLGANALAKLARQNSIPVNNGFVGFSDFDPKANYPIQFEGYLKATRNNGLIMCHPGLAEPFDAADAIAKSRIAEYDFFMSEKFLELLRQNQVKMVAMGGLEPPTPAL